MEPEPLIAVAFQLPASRRQRRVTEPTPVASVTVAVKAVSAPKVTVVTALWVMTGAAVSG